MCKVKRVEVLAPGTEVYVRLLSTKPTVVRGIINSATAQGPYIWYRLDGNLGDVYRDMYVFLTADEAFAVEVKSQNT